MSSLKKELQHGLILFKDDKALTNPRWPDLFPILLVNGLSFGPAPYKLINQLNVPQELMAQVEISNVIDEWVGFTRF